MPLAPLVRRQPVAGIARDERGVERGEPEHAVRRPVDRDGEQAVVAARPQPRDGPHCVAADPVGDEPLALRGLLERAARLGAEGDRHRGVTAGAAISSPSVGTGPPRARRISSATSPVQPVW